MGRALRNYIRAQKNQAAPMAGTARAFWGPHTWAQGGTSMSPLIATLTGHGSLQGSFNQQIITGTTYNCERWDYPTWGTFYKYGNDISSTIGIQADYNYARNRQFCGYVIPSGLTIKSAAFSIFYEGSVMGSSIIKYFANPSCTNPPGTAYNIYVDQGNDWPYAGTGIFLGSLPSNTYITAPGIIYIPPSLIVPGTTFYVGAATADDLSNTNSGNNYVYNVAAPNLILCW
jgi:hypothetical protein